MIGQVLGKCRIEAVLGAGNMGVVYRGHHQTLDVPVAVKTVKPELVVREDVVQRFAQEAQLAAQLRHDNVVRVFDVGQDGQHHFLVMEFLDGSPLDAFLRQVGPGELPRVVETYRALASALGAAHLKGIIHRDVKPANVIVVDGGRPILTDFGIAAALSMDSRLTSPGTLLGTPGYMSPEQARGTSDLDGRSDVFSLGMMMIESLTGQLPQDSDNVLEVIRRRSGEAIPPVLRLKPDLPAGLAEVIDRSTARDPSQRFADGNALAAALSGLAGQLGEAATRGTQADPQAPPARFVVLPVHEARTLADGVDLRFGNLNAVLRSVEQAQTGHGLAVVQHPKRADVLFFAAGQLEGAFSWSAAAIEPSDFETVVAGSGEGRVDGLAVSAAYYAALFVSCQTAPEIRGVQLGFADLAALIGKLTTSGRSGVLRLELARKVVLIRLAFGAPTDLFCGHWMQRGPDLIQDLNRLAELLQPYGATRVDFFSTDDLTPGLAEPTSLHQPLSEPAARLLVDFTVEFLVASGEALGQAFGLGSGPILEKYLDQAADSHPELLDGLELGPHQSFHPAAFSERIELLPQTGRRQAVMAAVQALLEGRAEAVRESLKNKRKRRKVLGTLVNAWEKYRAMLTEKGLTSELETLFEQIGAQA